MEFKNKLGEDSPIPKFIHLKNGVESLTTLEEGEFKVPIDSCIGLKVSKKEKSENVHEVFPCIGVINGWQLAKMKKSIPDMSLP